MKNCSEWFKQVMESIPEHIDIEVDLCCDISDRIYQLMQEKSLSKKQFADALGCRPSEVTKWLSGQHNFTIATIAKISAFFGESIVKVVDSHEENIGSFDAILDQKYGKIGTPEREEFHREAQSVIDGIDAVDKKNI